MFTSIIGKIFLQAYNDKFKTNFTPKEFFLKVYYPLFFDHQKYLMTAGNSPLENPKLSWDQMIKGDKPFETPEQRRNRLDRFLEKIDSGMNDASIAIGYPAADKLAATSGQVSMSLKGIIEPDESYLSWFGAGLGIGVQGGVTILFGNPTLLMDIFEGWKEYRKVLDATPMMKGNKINTWNAHWINHLYSPIKESAMPMDIYSEKNGLISIDTLSWHDLLVAISTHFDDPRMMGYIYNVGQTNTTIGFIPFVLPHVRKACELYVKYFGTDRYRKAVKLFGTAMGLEMACREGYIGLKALEPKGLKDIINSGKVPVYNTRDENKVIQFQTYQIWLLAMLNNEELWDKAKKFAETLQAFSVGGKMGRTGRSNAIKLLLDATTKRNFICQLGEIVEEAENTDDIVDIASIVNLMPSDNVPYFLTLIRFHYAVINHSK